MKSRIELSQGRCDDLTRKFDRRVEISTNKTVAKIKDDVERNSMCCNYINFSQIITIVVVLNVEQGFKTIQQVFKTVNDKQMGTQTLGLRLILDGCSLFFYSSRQNLSMVVPTR